MPASASKKLKSTVARKHLPAQLAVTQAKANLLQMIASVDEAGEYIITKRGKPVAKLIPFAPDVKPDIYGCMRKYGEIEIVGDIVGPEPDEWDALR